MNAKIVSHFLVNFLSLNNIKFWYILSCQDLLDVNTLHILSKNNIRCTLLRSQETIKLVLKERNDITYYGFVLDLTCPFLENSVLQDLNKYSMRLTHPWLILLNGTDLGLEDVFENVKLRMDSNVKVALLKEENDFEVFDIYNPGLHLSSKPKASKCGFWNGSYLFSNNLNFYQERKNMSNIKLRTGSVVLVNDHSASFEEYMLDSKNTELDTMSKFHYPLFLLLEDVHNFTHTVKIEDKWFGNYQNGTDEGIGKLLYEDKIDVTCTGASQRPPRVEVYDYLMPSYHFRPCYIFRNPGAHDPLTNEFLKPFTLQVWYLVAVTIVILSVMLKVFYRVEAKFTKTRLGYSWPAAFLTTLSIIFQQDASVFPTGVAGRISFLVLQILSILLYNYYTSSIISALLSRPPPAFHTLDELGHSKLEIGIENLPYTITWFEIMNDSDVQYIYKHKVFPSEASSLNIYEAKEGIKKVREGGFAYHTQLDTGYPIIAKTFDQDAICDITEIHMIPQVEAGMMVQKKSQYKELFHVSLRKIKEVGLVHRISQIWEAKKPACLSSARVVAVGMDQVFIAFLTLLIGMWLSLVLLVVEILWLKLNLDAKFVGKNKLPRK